MYQQQEPLVCTSGHSPQSIVINDTSLEVDTVWEGFEVGRDGGNPAASQFVVSTVMDENSLPLRGLVTVTQMTTMGQIKTHQSIMRSHDSLVDLKICRTATQALDVDTPFGRVEMESLESTGLASQLN